MLHDLAASRVARLGRLARLLTAAAMIAASALSAGPALASERQDKTLTETQALISAAHLPCTLTDAAKAQRREGRRAGGRRAAHIGDGVETTPPVAYEAACTEGLGYILFRSSGAAPADGPQIINCLEARTAAETSRFPYVCRLAANRDPIRAIQPLAARAGVTCPIGAARGLGHTAARSFFEVACAGSKDEPPAGPAAYGYVLAADLTARADPPVAAFSCIDAEANPQIRCGLTRVKATVEALHRYVTSTAPSCVPASQRLLGALSGGGEVFEVACRDGDRYRLRLSDKGDFAALTACDPAAPPGRCAKG